MFISREKTQQSLRRMHEALSVRAKLKRYIRRLLLGEWQGGDREVSLPLVVDHRKNGERHVRPGKEGKAALNSFLPRGVPRQCSAGAGRTSDWPDPSDQGACSSDRASWLQVISAMGMPARLLQG